MTFEEAKSIINQNLKADGSVSSLIVAKVMDSLKMTYAKPVKMTKDQKEDFDECYPLFQNIGEYPILERFTSRELLSAWLHPELIEVVE